MNNRRTLDNYTAKPTFRGFRKLACFAGLRWLLFPLLLCSIQHTYAQSPGGVSAGLGIWLKADAGITLNGATVSQWNDQSGNGKNVTQAIAASQATYVSGSSINFNPSLQFTTSQTYSTSSIFTSSGTANFKAFTATTIDGNAANNHGGAIFSELTANNRYIGFLPTFDGSFYFDAPFGYRITGVASINAVNLYTLSRLATQLTATNARKSMAAPVTIGVAVAGNNSAFQVGIYPSDDWFNGRLGELIIYNNAAAMTANQQLQIETYLAIKYGVTLDQTTATNYLASDSSVIWNGTANAAYENLITGIGRDDASALNQKQSRNQDTANSIVMGLTSIAASNAANAATFATNKNFELWGDNDSTINFVTAFSAISPYKYRMTRVWKVQETGTVGQVSVAVPASFFPSGGTYVMLVSSDSSFTTGVTAIASSGTQTINGISYTNFNIDYTNNQFFSFAISNFALTEACSAGSNLLMNGSFESPVVTAGGGNNIVASIPNWTNSGGGIIDLIRTPIGSNTNEPQFAADSVQYLALSASPGIMDQSFTLTSPAVLNYSGRFAYRGTPSANINCGIEIFSTSASLGTIVLDEQTLLTSADGFNWQTISGTTSLLPAGTYTFRFFGRASINYDDMSVCIASDAVNSCSGHYTMANPGTWVATASGFDAGFPPTNIIDGSTSASSIWASPGTSGTLGNFASPPYLTIDFGSVLNLAGFVLYPRNDAAQDISFYTAQYSNDGINFTTIQKGSLRLQNENSSLSGEPISAYFTTGSVTARYFRLIVNSTWAANNFASINELLPVICGSPLLPVRSCVDANLFNTGTNSSGTGTISVNVFDSNWTVAAVPGNTAANYSSLSHLNFVPATVIGNKAPGFWNNSPFGNANWICFEPTGKDMNTVNSTDVTTPNDYFYRYRFTISDPYLLPAFKLKLNFMADNSVYAIYINGINQTGLTNVPQSAAAPYGYVGFTLANQSTTTLKNNWQLGNNEIIVQVKSAPPNNGFLGQNISTCPGIDFGDAPASYNVSRATFGAGHIIELDANGNVDLRMGALIDAEADGKASTAISDDTTGIDDEDGVVSFPSITNTAVSNYSVTVKTFNNTGNTANLCGWIDWNSNGVFDSGEAECITVANGATSATLTWPSAIASGDAGVYARFRLTTDTLNPGTPNGPASNGEVEDYFIPFSIPLPVTLVNFIAVKQNNKAFLNWQISSEENAKSFIAESSTNGNEYAQIGIVAALGNNNPTIQQYSFTDNAPANGTDYYRLKIINKDGAFTYSTIRVLNFGTATTILAYPSPAKDKLTVTGIQSGMQLRIINAVGQQMTSILATGSTMQLDISRFAPDVYLLQAMQNGQVVNNIKVVKE